MYDVTLNVDRKELESLARDMVSKRQHNPKVVLTLNPHGGLQVNERRLPTGMVLATLDKTGLNFNNSLFKKEDRDFLTETVGHKKQRWGFTDKELRDPKSCRLEDEFVCTCPYSKEDAPEASLVAWRENGVIVTRDGKATNRYGDGAVGVSDEVRGIIDDGEPAIYTTDMDDSVETWRDVIVDCTGAFVQFAPEDGEEVTE